MTWKQQKGARRTGPVGKGCWIENHHHLRGVQENRILRGESGSSEVHCHLTSI